MMGGTRFLQSARDFPCTVAIGGGGRRFAPRFTLSRWDGAGCLGFDPEETEGGELRADSRRLLYRGRRRSHRFTILDGERFEYDLILNREPESNVVSLALAGADRPDFFRQPDGLPEPELAGSYAVYGREANGRFGTGKLCHIYTPRIIDAAGRTVWGRLDIVSNRLLVTIPETWLADARYPVTVDPIIGTQTIGANTHWIPEPGGDPERLYFEIAIPVNRFLVAENFSGSCTAYFYNYYDGDSDVGGRPVIYADGGNYPTTRRTANEAFIDFNIDGTHPAGWRSGSFAVNGTISAGSYIWFGAYSDLMFYPKFDYGARLYGDYHEGTGVIPAAYPLYSVSNYYDLKLSMYFEYSSAQTYTRKLVQDVSVGDLRKSKTAYERRTSMTAGYAEFVKAVRGVYVRLAGLAGARDYLLSRFLVAREEIVIRSRVTRDLVIESEV